MSKNNNVNPAHSKVAGRERQGEDIVSHKHKADLTQAQVQTSAKGAVAPPKAVVAKTGQTTGR